MADYYIYAQNALRQTIGQIDDFVKFDGSLVFNDVGSWKLEMDVESPAAELMQRGTRIAFYKDTTLLFTGICTYRKRSLDEDDNTVICSGFDDNVYLKWRVVHPQFASESPPYNVNAYDLREGVASTVMMGYVAANAGADALAVRQIAGLTLGNDFALGAYVQAKGRWQELLEFLQTIALGGGDLGFRLLDLEFLVTAPQVATAEMAFSAEKGNLSGYNYELDWPKVNYVYGLGAGELTDRLVVESLDGQSIIDFGRIEMVRDRRDTEDAGEVMLSLQEELEEGKDRVALNIIPAEQTQNTYGTEWVLGTRALAKVDGVDVRGLIREVKFELSEAAGFKVTPVIGTPNYVGKNLINLLMRANKQMRKRISQLERI